VRVACFISGGCRWITLREEWLCPDRDHQFLRLVWFAECKYCSDTRATLTSPRESESLFSIPHRYMHTEPNE